MSVQAKIISEIKRLSAFRAEELEAFERLAFSIDDYCTSEFGAKMDSIKAISGLRSEMALFLLEILENLQSELADGDGWTTVESIDSHVKGDLE